VFEFIFFRLCFAARFALGGFLLELLRSIFAPGARRRWLFYSQVCVLHLEILCRKDFAKQPIDLLRYAAVVCHSGFSRQRGNVSVQSHSSFAHVSHGDTFCGVLQQLFPTKKRHPLSRMPPPKPERAAKPAPENSVEPLGSLLAFYQRAQVLASAGSKQSRVHPVCRTMQSGCPLANAAHNTEAET
tara:strand:- start:123 stop:680 length:558 start_codon:yes stop_codon:yes gene_type:complete